MNRSTSLPWWGWSIVAFLILNMMLQRNVGLIWLVVIGIFLAAVFGSRSRTGGEVRSGPQGTVLPGPEGTVPSGPQGTVLPGPAPGPSDVGPVGPQDSPVAGSGWSGGAGQQPRPTSPWHTAGGAPGGGVPGGGGADPMPRIEVPRYPSGPTPPPETAYPSSATAYPSSSVEPPPVTPSSTPSTDPAVSLGQLQLARAARDLHTAATSGSRAEVVRVLDDIDNQAARLQTQLSGAGLPGTGRKQFAAGLKRLQRDVAAARGEDPPGAKVAHLVCKTGVMGQTGRYE